MALSTGITTTAQRKLHEAYDRVSKAAIFDALVDLCAGNTSCCDEDGEELAKEVREALVRTLERRGELVPDVLK
jgi:hypothetical protein